MDNQPKTITTVPEAINQEIRQYKESLESISIARELWRTTTRPLIEAVLNMIKKQSEKDFYVSVVSSTLNHDSVQLIMNDRPSGIVKVENDLIGRPQSAKALVLKGGALMFQQMFNGNVHVWILYPALEYGNEDNADHRSLIDIQPEDITVDFIFKIVEVFLKEINNIVTRKIEADQEVEQGTPRKMIGFFHTPAGSA